MNSFNLSEREQKLAALVESTKHNKESIPRLYSGLGDEDLAVRSFAYDQLILSGEKSNELERGIPLIRGDLIYAVCQSGVEWGSDWYYIHHPHDVVVRQASHRTYHTKEDSNGNVFECLSDAPEDKLPKIQTGVYAVTSPAYLFAYCINETTAQAKKEEAYIKAFSELPCSIISIYNYKQCEYEKFNLKDWVEANEVVIEDHFRVGVLDDWDKRNHLKIKYYTTAILRSLHEQKRFTLLRDIWERIGYEPMAYIQEYRVDRPCYLQIHRK